MGTYTFDDVIKALEDKKKIERDRKLHLKEINKRLSKPLFGPSRKTKTSGGQLKVSAQAGIRGFLK